MGRKFIGVQKVTTPPCSLCEQMADWILTTVDGYNLHVCEKHKRELCKQEGMPE